MPALSSSNLAGLRRLSDSALPDELSLYRQTQTNSADGVALAWSSVATLRGRVQPLSRSAASEEVGPAGGIQTVREYQVTVESSALTGGTAFKAQDRLLTAAGRWLEIRSVLQRGAYQLNPVLICSEVL